MCHSIISQPLMEVKISLRLMKKCKFVVSQTSGARVRPSQSFEAGVKIGAASNIKKAVTYLVVINFMQIEHVYGATLASRPLPLFLKFHIFPSIFFLK
jgi:hypothetical protein